MVYCLPMNRFTIKAITKGFGHSGFQRYFASTGWSFASRMLSMGISFFVTAFVARNLGPSNYGQLSYAVSFVSIFAFIATVGIDNILYRDLIKQPDQSKTLLGTGFTIKVIAGAIATTICSGIALLFVTNDISRLLIFIISGTFVINAFQVINHEFQAKVQSKYPSIVTVIVIAILNILKVATILSHKGVIYLACILLLEPILYALLYIYMYHTKLHEKVTDWQYNGKTARLLLHDSWPLIFSTAFALIYSRIDQVFIKNLIDARSVGIYDAAVRIAEVWYIIPSIVVTALFPAIINAKKISTELYYSRLKNLALLLITLAIVISVPITLLASPLIYTLYGSAFSGGIIILRVYVWATLGVFLGQLVINFLIAENYRKTLFFVSLIPMVMNVVLNILWIPHYGIAGAAYATLVSYICAPLSILLFKKTRNATFAIIQS